MTRDAKTLPTPAEFEDSSRTSSTSRCWAETRSVDRDTRLFEDGYMNSLRILDLIAVVEKTLGRRIPDRAVRLANFRTIATIVQRVPPGRRCGCRVASSGSAVRASTRPFAIRVAPRRARSSVAT